MTLNLPRKTNRSTFFVYLCLASALASLAACSSPTDSSNSSGDDVANEAIVRGRSASGSDMAAKSVVALVADLDQGQALCTGSVIDEATVLTAAHCVENDPSSLTVVFANDIKRADAEHMRGVVSYIQNPRWKKPTSRGRGDLALIHFDGGLPKGYVPVKLAATRNLSLEEGTSVLLIGYGVTDGLTHAGAGQLRLTQAPIVGLQSPTEVITDGRASSVCFGDSGGPALVLAGHSWIQWGVASSVTSEACNEASIHTNVASYSRWIKSAAAKLSEDDGSTDEDSNTDTVNDADNADAASAPGASHYVAPQAATPRIRTPATPPHLAPDNEGRPLPGDDAGSFGGDLSFGGTLPGEGLPNYNGHFSYNHFFGSHRRAIELFLDDDGSDDSLNDNGEQAAVIGAAQ